MDDALTIATLAVGDGGRIGICRLPGLYGGLAEDVETLLQWRPDIVVSMTEAEEMGRFGAQDLSAILARASVGWAHLPIHDFGELKGDSAEAWPALSARLHRTLAAGGGVILHCRGGQGRSGMIALRLLVERGEAPEAALARLRAVRPGAVETAAQFQWASMG